MIFACILCATEETTSTNTTTDSANAPPQNSPSFEFLAPEAQYTIHGQNKTRKKRGFCAAQATFCFFKLRHVIGLLKMNTNEKASLQLPRG